MTVSYVMHSHLTCKAQKARKQPSCAGVMPSTAITSVARLLPVTATSIWCMLLPPIQVWMPNQAHATRARVREGRLAPYENSSSSSRSGGGGGGGKE